MLKRISLLAGIVIVCAVVLSLTLLRDSIKSVFYIDHMERNERVDRMNIDKILSKLEISKGDIIADVGAGSGMFSRMFSELAGTTGKIYAVDINKKLLKHIEKINSVKGINNIATVLASENDPKIPEPVDLIFICDTLHYIDKQKEYVKTMSKYLKPEGRIAVISFFQKWPPMSNRFLEKDLSEWMNKAKLKRVAYYDDFIQDEYLAVYQMEECYCPRRLRRRGQ